MHFPKYWAKGNWQGPGADGETIRGSAWGWSDNSMHEAEQVGRERAQRSAFARSSQEDGSFLSCYPYATSPLREQILRQIGSSVISRNGLGCEVLNTEEIVFVDVDLPEEYKPGFIASLFGKKPENNHAELEKSKIALLVNFQQANSDFSFRVYRTAAGLRYLLTSMLLPPGDIRVQSLFQSVDCDPNYKNLCKLQESYRARLTPKPWRANYSTPPHRFPLETDEQMSAMETWIAGYQKESADYATCQFLQGVGRELVIPEVDPILREHDTLTCAHTGRPLA